MANLRDRLHWRMPKPRRLRGLPFRRRPRRSRWPGWLAAGGSLLFMACWGTLYRLGRVWGSTTEERSRDLPGDWLVFRPHAVTDHAIDIDATPEQIWPWLVQMGWHRGGWYTYRWVDALLFPGNAPAADRVLPEYQSLSLGDRIPDGPPESGCYFTVERLDPGRTLVLYSQTHLPPRLLGRPGVELSWSWTFALAETSAGRTRLHFRSRMRARPWWLLAAYLLLLVPADFLMGRSMCRGLKRRVEAAATASTAPLPG